MNALKLFDRLSSKRGRALQALAAPLTAAILMALPTSSMAGVYLSVDVAPPPIPIYEQAPIPGDGYIWTPGYWAYGDDGYFWVPGTWVQPPVVGVLWTPGYWGWSGGFYVFHEGYWGPHIGFYGGINYGWGYGGFGYEGGYWNHGHWYYNRGVNNFGGTHVTNVYDKTVINNNNSHTSFNGGTEGVAAKPTQQEMAAEHEPHSAPVDDQKMQVQAASHDQAMYASVNHGAPAVAATSRPGGFRGAGVVQAHPVNPQDREAVSRAEQAHAVYAATGKPINTGYNRGSGRGNGYDPRQASQRPGGGYQPARGVGPQGRPAGAPGAQPHYAPKGAPAVPAKGDDKDHR